MKNYILFLGLLAFLFLGGLVISCKGDEEITVDTPLPTDNIPEEEGENETPEQSFQKSCATIIERITTENVSAIQNVNTLANVVDGHLDKMKEDGSFSDVNYEREFGIRIA